MMVRKKEQHQGPGAGLNGFRCYAIDSAVVKRLSFSGCVSRRDNSQKRGRNKNGEGGGGTHIYRHAEPVAPLSKVINQLKSRPWIPQLNYRVLKKGTLCKAVLLHSIKMFPPDAYYY